MDASERGEFWCSLCHECHSHGEAGFRLPDAAFALTLPRQERARFQGVDNLDVAVLLGKHCFVRGVADIPIRGTDDFHGIGFWAQISLEDFANFELHERMHHPSYEGRIANQSTFLGPTLGLAARVDFLAPSMRPSLTLHDQTHPLARAQRFGIDRAQIDAWLAEKLHAGNLPPPLGVPVAAELATHGWELTDPRELGGEPVQFDVSPEVGDAVKVIVSFIASDHAGDPTRLRAGWWITLDDVSNPNAWSGLLANVPLVPAPIGLGSRIWLHPRHVIELRR